MKKLSIRSLLIVILALVLVFTLVACGDKGNDNPTPTPTPTPTKDTTNVKNYFNTLWEKSTGIGDEAIAPTDDLKVSLGLTVQLDFVDSMDGTVQDSVDVGVLLDLVLDRSSGKDKSTNTAIKAKIYDPSAAQNWFTAYYFFNDVDNIYIDYAGQNVKIPFSYLNDTYNKSFYNFIYNDKPVAGKSIAEIVTALTANMGKNWDLNTLVGDVMRVFNIDVDGLKDSIGGVFEMLGLSVDEAFDAQGNLNIKNILTNDTVAGFFVNNVTGSTTANGVTTYTTQLDPEVLGLLDMLGSSLPAGLTVAGTTYGNETDSAKKAKAFLNEMFASTAEVVLNISGNGGIELSVKADVNAEAGVGVTVKLGAKAYVEANYTDLAPEVETDGWYVFTITKA